MKSKILYYDGKNSVRGRLASTIAKKLIEGHKVVVKNVANIIITGNLKREKKEYMNLLSVGTERKGPFFKRSEIGYFKKAVEGMLPIKKGPGKRYAKNLYLYPYEAPIFGEEEERGAFESSLNKKFLIREVTFAIRGTQNKK